jgi:hypothetical protein
VRLRRWWRGFPKRLPAIGARKEEKSRVWGEEILGDDERYLGTIESRLDLGDE